MIFIFKTLSSVKLVNLLIVRTKNELSLKVFKALGFYSFFELPRVWESENSNKPSIGMPAIFCIILKTCIISILFRRYNKVDRERLCNLSS